MINPTYFEVTQRESKGTSPIQVKQHGRKEHQYYPLKQKKGNIRCFQGSSWQKLGQIGFNFILKGTVKTLEYNAKEETKEYTKPNQLNKNVYNDLILVQDYTVCF